MIQDKAQLLEDVKGLIASIIGQDVDLNDNDIGFDTSFSHDLELESIEFVLLSEKLQERFGDKLDFAGWLSHKELDEIIKLKVGDVVEFIGRCH